MSSPSDAVEAVTGAATAVSAPAQAAGAAAGPNAAAATGDPTEANSFTQVSNMGELKDKAPKVYNAMLMGIAMHITSEMKEHQEELKKLRREYEDR